LALVAAKVAAAFVLVALVCLIPAAILGYLSLRRLRSNRPRPRT
jgi:hypothetical protein